MEANTSPKAFPPANIPKKLLSPYSPQDTENLIYEIEEKSGLFNPDTCIEAGITKADAETFTIVLPPPNVTGVLHLGHALMITIQDTLIRFERMRGKRTLWIPGTDHAAIATQSVVEKEISKKEGKSRYDLGREEMLSRIQDFASTSHDTIVAQIRRMGASVDWSREAFTLDEARNLAVRTVFKKMYDDGLIYRGHRLINWDPKGQTTIADDELVYEEKPAILYTFKYSKDFPISISTTRPETKVGDVAVAVNPEDERYAEFIGKEYDIADFCGVKLHIKIIADASVDKDYGTGALGVTPAHSMVDAEMAEKHKLPTIQVIDEKARMMVGADIIKNKKTSEAREIVAIWLRENGLMEKEEGISHRVATAERTGGTVEPLPKTQWFVNVNKEFTIPHSEIDGITSGSTTTLKDIMRQAVKNGQVSIIPEHFDKTYFHWIENLRDWCISRQIWYGHRIPVWYRAKSDESGADKEMYCGIDAPKNDENGSWTQDEDTLDTWFSSGLWTFSTMGWPKPNAVDLKAYHPTNILVTGYEILFFWVARMILMTGYTLGTIPFNTVYLNGTVRDAQGRKMSKSLGNGGDPIETANKYGADALRMFLATSTTPGTDSRIYEDKIKGYKHFSNKIWNIARFVLTMSDEQKIKYNADFTNWSEKDSILIDNRNNIVREITKEIETYKLHLAAEHLYHYVWTTFADVILEESKLIFKNDTSAEKESRGQFLLHTLRMLVTILHPFMPYVTEELWSLITTERSLTELSAAERKNIKPTSLLMATPWPKL